MGFELIVTLGPAIFGNDKIKEIDALGSCIYRINGAHADEVESLEIINFTTNKLTDATIIKYAQKIFQNQYPEPKVRRFVFLALKQISTVFMNTWKLGILCWQAIPH